ncbi:hypothetical protein ABT352_39120 [Streptosporangium sp. NPDC000563]|uniref:hypothetical protein n=1 Tax=Streptosporangium sp. NPDC000563 TaxID=3154366 RepID=UPI00332F6CE0
MVRIAARARSMEAGASGRPVRAEGAALRCAVYSVTVAAVAGSGARPVAVHHAVKAVQSVA